MPLKNVNFSIVIRYSFKTNLLILLLVSSLTLINSACQPLHDKSVALTPPTGAELFKSKCSKCHNPELALNKYRTEAVWRDTITRMKNKHGADITPNELEALVSYHVERQKQEAAIFREKCEKCHSGKVFLERKLTPDEARSIIKLMQQKAGNTIEEKDIDIIVRYHIQAQRAELEENFRGMVKRLAGGQGGLRRGMALFLEKCSACHDPSRALSVMKDPETWSRTIKRMQSYSNGSISNAEADELIQFHISRQQRELNTFRETCTKCHDDERINSRSLNDDQWLAIIKRMQKKAPEFITDEKVTLLAAYFHRREFTLARIFSGKCGLCHTKGSASSSPLNFTDQMDSLIVLAKDEFGESMKINDVNNLKNIHIQRQQRNMQLYTDCSRCHPDGIPRTVPQPKETGDKRSRSEWISFIAALQGVELTKDVQTTINSQIEFHVSKF